MAHYTVEAYNDMIRALEKFKSDTAKAAVHLANAADACRSATGNDDPSKQKSTEIYQKLQDFVKIYSRIDFLIEALKKQRNKLSDI